MDKIRVLFVVPDSNHTSEVMSTAFESCKQNSVNVSWIEEAKFNSTDLNKTDFVVFEHFKGRNFDHLKESKCARVVGPWCILICLTDGNPIPNFTWPIYNVAMAGSVVTCSHLPKMKKLEIKERVQLMGGCYTDNLMSANTHLVTESVKSEKYIQAAESGVKLMVSKWVDSVWEASQNKKIHCNDADFDKYRCLPFHNLTVCSTGFPNIEMRKELTQNVTKNGGVFTGSLALAKTDVLVVYGENGVLSQKYKAARNNPNVNCVTLDWINDSIAKGYALPHHLYTVKKVTSTPTKVDETCPNFSMISAIGECNERNKSGFEETRFSRNLNSPFMSAVRNSPNKRRSSSGDEITEIIDGLDIKKAKRAGQYLDGCSVYLAGFKQEQREKLCKVLNLSGATRYDDISDRLTHIIVGDQNSPEVKIIKSKNYPISLVSIQWLLDSMDRQQAVDEETYLIRLHTSEKEQFSSPLGRKGLNLLRSDKTLTSSDIEAASESTKEPDSEKELMQQYLRSSSQDEETDTLAQLLKNDSNFNSRPDLKQSTQDSCSSQNVNIFASKKFVLTNFTAEEYQYMKDQIESAFGTVMSKTYKGIPDFVVAPMFVTSPIQMSALEIVNNLWVLESIQEGEECPIEYYGRPLSITTARPLENCVVTISSYVTYERNFLKELIEELGGVFQEQFARISCEKKKILASTHLVSLEADGKKYHAALKWGLPVVDKDWLLECAKSGKLEPVDNFLIGEAKSDDARKAVEVKRILTPLNQKQPLDISKTDCTPPVRQRLFKNVDTPCTQVTPVNKLMEEVRRTNLLGTPQTPEMFKDIKTPESPFGACIRPHLSAKSKKELMRQIQSLPDCRPPPQGRKSTPLSEVKRRCWKKLLGHKSPSAFPSGVGETADKNDEEGPRVEKTPSSDPLSEIKRRCWQTLLEPKSPASFTSRVQETTDKNDKEVPRVNTPSPDPDTQEAFMSTKLKQIEDMASALTGNLRRKTLGSTMRQEVGSSNPKESQPFTVGWDYNEGNTQSDVRIFMLSGVESSVRASVVAKIESLGGQVTDLSTYDPKATHLLSPLPARNEKTLACMASGKWILHISYVDRSLAAGKFLDEEEFEFGNPRSVPNIRENSDAETKLRLQSMHWWRKEITRRGYGAFNDMRAIVVAQRRDPLVRVIEAGGGQIVDAKPPFSGTVHATHCLLEARCVPDFSVYNPLALQGILCINTLYISEFLYRKNEDVKVAILPHYASFYKH